MKLSPLICTIIMSLSTQANPAIKNQLSPCPNSPNCVSTQAQDQNHFFAPFKITGAVDQAWIELKNALLSQNRTQIVFETKTTLQAQASSLVFGFIDDIEVILDTDARLIHIRSAARSGYYDFGVNRKRVKMLHERLQQALVVV